MLSHKILQHLNQLQQKKYRREVGEFLVEGLKGVKEALLSGATVNLIVMEGKQRDEAEFKEIIKLADSKGVVMEFCARQDIGVIKTTDTFPGVLAVIEQPDYSLEDVINGKPVVCLAGIKDPGNLGTIIRTADWFGVENIILSQDCVDLYNPKVVRSTMGSIFKVKVFHSTDLLQTLDRLKGKYSYNLIGLTMNGENIDKINQKAKAVYVLGGESHGLSDEIENILDKRYTIQGKGKAESLNVAVAAGILMSILW